MAHPHSDFVKPHWIVWACYEHQLAGDFDELIPAAHNAIREFERFDPVGRLPVVAGILPLALGDQGRDDEALAAWRRVAEFARVSQSRAMLKVSIVAGALHARARRAGPHPTCSLARTAASGSGGASTRRSWRAHVCRCCTATPPPRPRL